MARVEYVAVLGALSLLALVFELVRRRALSEGHSLLWLATALALLVLALWRSLLDVLARVVGIYYPPTALFVVGFGFITLLMLQFSVQISRLTMQNKDLVQRLGLLEWRLQQLAAAQPSEPAAPDAEPDARQDAGPQELSRA